METWAFIIDLFTPISILVGVIVYFVKRDSKSDSISNDQTNIRMLIDAMNKKIELASIDASNMRTEIQLLKLRVDIIDREIERGQ